MVRSCALVDEIKRVVAMRAELTAACEVKSDGKRMLISLGSFLRKRKRLRDVGWRNRQGV